MIASLGQFIVLAFLSFHVDCRIRLRGCRGGFVFAYTKGLLIEFISLIVGVISLILVCAFVVGVISSIKLLWQQMVLVFITSFWVVLSFYYWLVFTFINSSRYALMFIFLILISTIFIYFDWFFQIWIWFLNVLIVD